MTTPYQWKPTPCSYCGVIMRTKSECAFAYNLGGEPESFCGACAPPSKDPADAIKLMQTFMNLRQRP